MEYVLFTLLYLRVSVGRRSLARTAQSYSLFSTTGLYFQNHTSACQSLTRTAQSGSLEHNGPVFADAYRMVFRNQGLLQDILVRVRNSRLWMTSINCCTNGGGFLTFRLIMVSTVVMYHAQFPTGSIYGMPAKKTDPPKRLYISKAGYHTTDENNLFLVLHPFRQVSIILLKMYYV